VGSLISEDSDIAYAMNNVMVMEMIK
jgi:hypothetical protein